MDCAGRNERGMSDKKEGERLVLYCFWGLFNKKKCREWGAESTTLVFPPSWLLSSPCYRAILIKFNRGRGVLPPPVKRIP